VQFSNKPTTVSLLFFVFKLVSFTLILTFYLQHKLVFCITLVSRKPRNLLQKIGRGNYDIKRLEMGGA